MKLFPHLFGKHFNNLSRNGRSYSFGILTVAVGFLFTSCMTMADYNFSAVDGYTYEGQFSQALGIVNQDTKLIYKDHDEVLRLLDQGMLLQYAGEYEDSTENLSKAEQLIYDYYAKSVTQGITAYISNDMAMDYSGTTYEDIYTNIFMALNYIQSGTPTEALVEIKRFDNKLKAVSSQYQTRIAEMQKQIKDDNGVNKLSVENIEFHNSALARYLSMILYRGDNNYSSAQVDMKLIESAFTTEKNLYNFKMPSTIKDELSVDKNTARLNLIAFSGRAPIKTENVLRVGGINGSYYKIAVPVMERRPSSVVRIRLTAENINTGNIKTVYAEKIESIENIIIDTFKQDQSVIYGRAFVRSLLKSTTTTVFNALSNDEDNGAVFRTLMLVSMVANEVTERADVRTSRFFPASASVSGINLEPGNYKITVEYLNIDDNPILIQQNEDFEVDINKLNLIESVCLR